MTICFPCRHEVDEATAPSWEYKGYKFYFCGDVCQDIVKADPERWLVVAQSQVNLEQEGHHHDHDHDHEHGHEHHGHEHHHD